MNDSTLKPWKIPVRGDLYTFATPALKISIEWACIKRHYDDKDLWFMVPFDRVSLVGTWDIAVHQSGSTSMVGTLRCGRGIWLHIDDLSRGALMRRRLDKDYVNEAADRLSALVNDLTPTHKPEVDELPEYQNWLQIITDAGDLLELTFSPDMI